MLDSELINGESADWSSYSYSYPHKSSYGPLDPPVAIDDAWRDDDLSKLALYVHLPFCEMRCGFCNLFTQSQPQSAVVDRYLETLARQMRVVQSSLPAARFAQFAVGGGTPTFLAARQLESLLRSVEDVFDVSVADLHASVETSPATATTDRLRVLKSFGVERISIGVQSFVSEELSRLGRPQDLRQLHAALDAIRRLDFPRLNIDLIYGDPRQTSQTWLASLGEALRYEPEELYLYPLYVRPETGLGNAGRPAAGHRLDLYRLAREFLRAENYEQVSLRCFRRKAMTTDANPRYACQRDGMLGFGCGSRSYTQSLHYSTRFAVPQPEIRSLVQEWTALSDSELAHATHGIRLSESEQRRRFVILSLLQADGLDLAEYQARFGTRANADLPELMELQRCGWLAAEDDRIVMTVAGMEQSDRVGPLLYSESVRSRLREFVER